MAMRSSPAQIKLFNTLTRGIELLVPHTPGQVDIYCCGPTVYNFQHIGNLRTYIFEDLLVRMLRYGGYKVRHVMNITDVGHLVSDADEGEDKMLLAAKREGKTSEQLANYYSGIFFDHCGWLNITRPDIVCKATEHIPQMIALIKRLEEKGVAYNCGGNVYFDVSRFPEYGKLAGLNLEKLKAGARIEVDDKKRNPLDFALWFTKSKFEGQELQWDSPWGRGYPGWHIECSAMSMKYLGESFDIHCGGIDHIPLHHTNEIAQSEGATGKPFVRLWMHGGFLVLGKEKMSKSTGEFLTLDLVKKRGFEPLSYRLLCLGGSYRNELTWSWQALESAANSLKNLKNAVISLRMAAGTASAEPVLDGASEKYAEAFDAELFNDLKIPNALSVLHEALGDNRLALGQTLALILRFDAVLGLGMDTWQPEEIAIPGDVHKLVSLRENARKSRDFAKADALRKEISALGFGVEDTPGGPRLKPL